MDDNVMPMLPPEILYLIIRELEASAPEDRRALRSCSLANHTLSSISRKRLFQDVDISFAFLQNDHFRFVFYDGFETTGRKFRNLLRRAPHIAQYVDNLTIVALKEGGGPGSPALAGSPNEYSSSPSFSLYEIVPRLVNLKGLFTRSTSCHAFSLLDARTGAFFSTISSSVLKLGLDMFVGLPLSMFSSSANLKELRIPSIANCEQDSRPCAAKAKLRHLEAGSPSSSVESFFSLLNTPSSPFDISHLRSLTVSDPFCSVSALEEVAKLCSNTLEVLDFFLTSPVRQTEEPLASKRADFGPLRNIRHLTIRCRIPDFIISSLYLTGPRDNLSDVAATLSTLPFDAFLPMQLWITLRIKVSYLLDFESDLPSFSWSEVVSVLESDQVAPSLAGVEFVFQRFEYDQGSVAVNMSASDLADVLDNHDGLKRLKEKGVLFFKSV